MAERLTRYDRARWGVETTHGTSPTTNFKRLSAISARLGVDGEFDEFTPEGSLLPTIVSPDREISTVEIEGRVSFSDFVYPASAAWGTATITSPDATNAPTARTWGWDITGLAEIDPVSFTIEQGQAAYAERAAYVTLSQFGFSWGRGPLEVTGEGFGRKIEKGITLSATGLTDVAAKPAFGKQVNVFLDDSFGAFGTTQLTRAISGDWQFGTGRQASFYVNENSPDWAHTADGDPARDVTLVMQADSAGMTILDNMRDGSTKFLQIEIVGAVIGGAITYKILILCAVKVIGAPSRDDQDRVYGVEWPLGIVYDSSWGKAASIAVTNELSAL